jgi:predicted DNA-binding protein
MQKTRLNIYLNPQQKDKLEKLSAKTGAPLSELIRRAVELYLKKES